MENSKNLKGKENENGRQFYVNQQVPEHIIANKKKISHEIQKIKAVNFNKPQGQKVKYVVKKNKLYTDGVPVAKPITSPSVDELFVEEVEQERMDKLKMYYSEPKEEKGSVFTAIAVKVSNIAEIRRAYKKIRQMNSNSDHIPMAYDCQKRQNCNDDGEYSGGLCLQKLIESHRVINKAIFIVRKFGGRRLGPKRFQIMEDVAKQALAKMK